MKSPQNFEGQGIIEYLLLVIIVVLFILIISKLFGPAISNYIQDLLKNV
jgi:hypothetical protein